MDPGGREDQRPLLARKPSRHASVDSRRPRPQTITLSFRWVVLLALMAPMMLLTSCNKPLRLQVVLGPQESIEKGTPVFVDDMKAGSVVSVGTEAGDRVANIEIDEDSARERLRVGAVRLKENGLIRIRTDAVEADAPLLPHGARVPTSSKLGYLVTKYSGKSTIVVILIGLAAVVVLWLVFRSLVGTVGLILCVALAGVITQVSTPYVAPWVEMAMEKLGPPAPTSTGTQSPEGGTRAPGGSDKVRVGGGNLPTSGEVAARAEDGLIEVVNMRPSPLVVTWCAVFIVLFIALNIILGRAARVWRK